MSKEKSVNELYLECKNNSSLKGQQLVYGKPNEARNLEKSWQKYINGRAEQSLSEYEKAYVNNNQIKDIEEFIPCLLCGSKIFTHLFTPKKKDWSYQVVCCSECNFLFRNPNIIPRDVHKLYDQVNYNNFLSGKYSKQRQNKYRSVLSSFKDLLPKKPETKVRPSVLDFGCGNGLALEVMEEKGYESWGVDFSPESVEEAKKRLSHERIWCGDLTNIGELKGKKFDLITMWSVLAHIARPIDTLKDIRKFLKPNGALLVYTVNANSLILKNDLDQWNGFTRNHLVFFSPETAEKLFKKSGFGEFYWRPHYAQIANPVKNRIPSRLWSVYKQNVLESQGGNMNRFLVFNKQ